MKNIDIEQIRTRLIPIRHDTNVVRQKRRYSSKLDPYRCEILTLHNQLCCSLRLIQLWLKEKKGVSVSKSALLARIKHWSKLKKDEAS